MTSPISRVITRADLLELPQTCMSLLAASPAPLGDSRRVARPAAPAPYRAHGPAATLWKIPVRARAAANAPRATRRGGAARVPVGRGRGSGRAVVSTCMRATRRGGAARVPVGRGRGSGRAVVSACMRAEVSRAAYPQRACNQRPSEAHQKLIRRSSEGHQKVIRGHQKLIRSSSEVIVSEDAYP